LGTGASFLFRESKLRTRSPNDLRRVLISGVSASSQCSESSGDSDKLPIAAGSARKGMMVMPLLNALSSCHSIRSDRLAYSVKTTIMILQDATAFEMDWSNGTPIFRSRGRIQHRIPTDSSSLQIALAVVFPSIEWLITTSCGICGTQSSASNFLVRGRILWSKIRLVKSLQWRPVVSGFGG
jgi:hypothetical protein